ncbi:methyltransferase [Chryseobacterium sp. c4a]|uniref:methyltransferase n=1 Tax=Chryseobacterium sp. c4a TaxID=1573582 RepID=UPI00135B321C|nr:methyltransferase [Chryseobacterium sp. c4a]
MKTQNIKPESTFKMYEVLSGIWIAGCLNTATELNIADKLSEGAKSISLLAKETKSYEWQLYRIMRALSSVGIFEELENKTFALNDLGAALQTDVPGTLKNFILVNLNESFTVFRELTYSAQTGNVPFEQVHGMNLWDYYKKYPEKGVNFGKGMTGLSEVVLKSIMNTFDFSSYKTIADIGGGNGSMIFDILNASPDSTGIIFDEANVIEETDQLIPEHLENRCSTVSGSFFNTIPDNADLYTMKWILHDWNDEECIQILKNIYQAMPKGGKLLIIEAVIPDDSQNKPHIAKLQDIIMMACLTGKERTLNEFKLLIENAGLRFNRFIPIGTDLSSIIECEKI